MLLNGLRKLNHNKCLRFSSCVSLNTIWHSRMKDGEQNVSVTVHLWVIKKEFAISTGRIQFDKFIKYVLED